MSTDRQQRSATGAAASDEPPSVDEVLSVVEELPDDADANDHAEVVGLVYVSDDEPGIRRIRSGKGFRYLTHDGDAIKVGDERRERLEELAVPPAWQDVWICPAPHGHIQATGTDDAGRKQYLYHPAWRAIRDATKFHRLRELADAMPGIRDRVDLDLRKRSMSRERVLAVVVALLDETLIRIGSDRHTDPDNGAIGLTTMRCEHVDVHGGRIEFSFPSKGGKDQELELRHPRLAHQVLRCEEIPGQHLFGYRDGDGTWHPVDSGTINDYLRDTAQAEVTAKDFRTWGGTVAVAEHLHELGPPDGEHDADRKLLAAIDEAADRLGNTRAVCRASYLDPRVANAYLDASFDDAWDGDGEVVDRLGPAERAVVRILDAASNGSGNGRD